MEFISLTCYYSVVPLTSYCVPYFIFWNQFYWKYDFVRRRRRIVICICSVLIGNYNSRPLGDYPRILLTANEEDSHYPSFPKNQTASGVLVSVSPPSTVNTDKAN